MAWHGRINQIAIQICVRNEWMGCHRRASNGEPVAPAPTQWNCPNSMGTVQKVWKHTRSGIYAICCMYSKRLHNSNLGEQRLRACVCVYRRRIRCIAFSSAENCGRTVWNCACLRRPRILPCGHAPFIKTSLTIFYSINARRKLRPICRIRMINYEASSEPFINYRLDDWIYSVGFTLAPRHAWEQVSASPPPPPAAITAHNIALKGLNTDSSWLGWIANDLCPFKFEFMVFQFSGTEVIQNGTSNVG